MCNSKKDSSRDFISELYKNKNSQNSQREYALFFDETNNSRVFKLRENSFNVDEKRYFILGGIGVLTANSKNNVEDLWKKLKGVNNQEEIKFKSIAGGAKDFPALLKKTNFQEILKWLFSNDYRVHFEFMDNFYYSITDIIDSLDFFNNTDYHRLLKSVLYQAMKYDRKKTLEVLSENKYPNVEKPERFICGIINVISSYMMTKSYKDNYEKDYARVFQLILTVLEFAKNQKELIFLTNNKRETLIDEYPELYRQAIKTFAEYKLFFDHEPSVENKFNSHKNSNFTFIESNPTIARTKNEFIDLDTHRFIQLSDVFCGALSYFLNFVGYNADQTESSILVLKQMNHEQKKFYIQWCKIIKQSLRENPNFVIRICDIFFELLDKSIL
ncbi:DUF3800 domain-containing protein [Levilactobacillus namurensis]|uniref:DUF3800 domain-containing protein n=1 Tax=Levilactobacillus namurensis TaxID=380393 RepID=A0AAW8W2E8_9LACO|nr:DUF3800 domain-containing protein [Levilactobacillus namurensis]MDT7013667.1 hypothetical protein [Levilactobacillus namurensis]